MELSDEKTLITHSSEKARFLGYDVCVRRNSSIKPHGKGHPTQRTLNGKVELLIPKDKVNKFLFSKGVVRQKKCDEMFPICRVPLRNSTDLEIITIFNAEVRGIYNYYSLASNFCDLHYFNYLMEYSCLKTLAAKHKTRITKIIEMFKDGKGSWAIPYETKAGGKLMYFAKYSDCKSADMTDTVTKAAITIGYNRNTFEKRLNANVCELCGKTGAEKYEIHHIHKLKDLKGKELWERAMISKKRKTLVVCHECHQNIHHPQQ